ncbi:hypothetical protein [Brevundimonas mediterranea]
MSDPADEVTGGEKEVGDHRLDGEGRTPAGEALDSSADTTTTLTTAAPEKLRPAKARPSPLVRGRLLQLLTRLVGEDLAEQSYLKILNADESLDELAMSMACGGAV